MDENIYESFSSQEVRIKFQAAFYYRRRLKEDIYLAAVYGRDFSFCGDPAKAQGISRLATRSKALWEHKSTFNRT
jgi:hypothetical protein